MSSDTELSLDDELRASGVSLAYADWADVHAGRYQQVAERLLRQARWLRRVRVVWFISLMVLLAYDLVRYFRGGNSFHLFLAGMLVVFLLRGVPRFIQAHQAYVSVADRLRRAADAAQPTGVM